MSNSRTSNFSHSEDARLVDIYLDITQDAIKSNNQTREEFWTRIFDSYHADRTEPGISDRTSRSLQTRITLILKDTRKFNGCLRQVEYQNPSGADTQEILKRANSTLKLCKGYEKGGFKFMHVWEDLKEYIQAECATTESASFDEAMPNSPNLSISSFNINLSSDDGSGLSGSPSQRPEGVKKQKGKRKQEPSHFATNLSNSYDKLREVLVASAESRDRKLKLSETLRDDNVLMLDVNTITDPEKREYFRLEQQQIMRKRRNTQQGNAHGFDMFRNLFPGAGGSGDGLSDY